jgi:hypothetical protein
MYPIQKMVWRGVETYNLRSISLIPLVVELGIELHQFEAPFDPELRGGLLLTSEDDDGTIWNVLQCIICYHHDEYDDDDTKNENNNNNEHLDQCFSTVWKKLRDNGRLKKEDIRQYNIIGKMLCSLDSESFIEKQFRYIVDWDPMVLTIPCMPEHGNWLPMHWSDDDNDDDDSNIQRFSSILQAGLQYFPEKIGFVFCEATQTDLPNEEEDSDDENETEDEIQPATPFQLACKRYGHDAVIKVVNDCISDHCTNAAAAAAAAAAHDDVHDDGHGHGHGHDAVTAVSTLAACTESTLLFSAVTEETIHLDGLYILIRKDPTAALLRLQQKLEQVRDGKASKQQ